MTDTFGILLSSFLTGDTGMRLQTMGDVGKDALLLGTFLIANEFDNMIGLYELSDRKLCRKLPALDRPAVQHSFELLEQEHFAYFDPETEFVWVREMARVRLQLVKGQASRNDKRRKGACALYQRLPSNPFLGPFYDRYHVEIGLPTRRGSPPTKEPEGASIGHRRGIDAPSAPPCTPPVPEIRDQGSGTSDQRSVISDQVPERTAAAPRITPVVFDKPQPNVAVITAVIRKELLPLGISESDLPQATKDYCSRFGIDYDSISVRKAVESALYRAGKLAMVKADLTS